jgi:hypothetical protein
MISRTLSRMLYRYRFLGEDRSNPGQDPRLDWLVNSNEREYLLKFVECFVAASHKVVQFRWAKLGRIVRVEMEGIVVGLR